MMVILPGREDVLEDTTQARGLELGRHFGSFGTSVIESTRSTSRTILELSISNQRQSALALA